LTLPALLNMVLAGKAKSIEDLRHQARKHRGDIWPILRLASLSQLNKPLFNKIRHRGTLVVAV
jgi:hypothetical protein